MTEQIFALIEQVNARMPSSVTPSTRIEIHPADWLTLVDEIERLRREVAQREASFDLRWKASMRAIKRWQEAHPGNDLVWPDHADLCVWLMEQLDARSAAVNSCVEPEPCVSHIALEKAEAALRAAHEPAVLPGEMSKDIERRLMATVMEADDAFQKSGATGTKNWLREFFMPRLSKQGLGVGDVRYLHRLPQPSDDALDAARWREASAAMCHSFDGQDRTYYLRGSGRETFEQIIDKRLAVTKEAPPGYWRCHCGEAHSNKLARCPGKPAGTSAGPPGQQNGPGCDAGVK